jgi:putative FmdB family regulatory protein
VPIYAYKCSSCGHAEDSLQKLSAAPLTTCPACHQETYVKQVTAAGFQLKGSGWYVTDFRNNGSSAGAATAKDAKSSESVVGGEVASTAAAATAPAGSNSNPAGTGATTAPPAPVPATASTATKPSTSK